MEERECLLFGVRAVSLNIFSVTYGQERPSLTSCCTGPRGTAGAVLEKAAEVREPVWKAPYDDDIFCRAECKRE